jgi:hypothetical protein
MQNCFLPHFSVPSTAPPTTTREKIVIPAAVGVVVDIAFNISICTVLNHCQELAVGWCRCKVVAFVFFENFHTGAKQGFKHAFEKTLKIF